MKKITKKMLRGGRVGISGLVTTSSLHYTLGIHIIYHTSSDIIDAHDNVYYITHKDNFPTKNFYRNSSRIISNMLFL